MKSGQRSSKEKPYSRGPFRKC